MNEEARRIHLEFLEVLRRQVRNAMNKQPKSIVKHCADIGICWTTFDTFMNKGKNVIHPSTFSKIVKWLESNKMMLSEEVCQKYHDAMMAATAKENKDI